METLRRLLSWLFAPATPWTNREAFNLGAAAFYAPTQPLPADMADPDWRAGYACADAQDRGAW